MVFWSKKDVNAADEPEEENVQNSEPEYAESNDRGTEDVDVEHPESALTEVMTVDVQVGDREYTGLSLYELPGLQVMETQKIVDEGKLHALWDLFKLAMPEEAVSAAEGLNFLELQTAIMRWAADSSLQASELFMERQKKKLRETLGLNPDGSDDKFYGLDKE